MKKTQFKSDWNKLAKSLAGKPGVSEKALYFDETPAELERTLLKKMSRMTKYARFFPVRQPAI